MRYRDGIPCPDDHLPAGLRQSDIDQETGQFLEHSEKYERELERADRMMDEEKDWRAEEEFDRRQTNTTNP